MRETLVGAIHNNRSHVGPQLSEETISQAADMCEALVHFFASTIERASESHRESNRLGSGPASVLLMSAPGPRRQLHSSPQQ